jgi:multidrug efflux pump subunit AcrB
MVIAIVTTIAGLISLFAIPVAQYPDIVPPQVSVTTVYPGASASVVEATVAQPIEAQIVGVDKVALSKLPSDVRTQGVTVKKQSSALLGVVSLYSPNHTRDELFISNYATINLIDPIRSTPGVGDARLFGPQDYAMRVWLQTQRMTGLGLAVSDVISAIQSQNTQAPVGRIGSRPVANDQQIQLNIETKGRLASVEEFKEIIIRTNPDGSVLKLKDIARVELGAANMDRSTRLNGAGAALIAVYQSPGANALTSLGAVKKLLGDAQKNFPHDLA